MVDVVSATNPTRLRIVARPNSAAGQSGLIVTMCVFVPSLTLAGTVFWILGAWPVTVFMGLNLLALIAGFAYVERHAGDFEAINLDAERLIVDSHTAQDDRHWEFNTCWVQVNLKPTALGVGNTLAFRCHDKEITFGRLLSDDERTMVGRELRSRLARIRR
jgi:uncharacterized membrane protein